MRIRVLMQTGIAMALTGGAGIFLNQEVQAASRGAPGGSAAATIEISLPGCAAMERLAMTLDGQDRVPINRWVGKDRNDNELTLVRAVAAPAFAETFGKPLLSWNTADQRAFHATVSECTKVATKAKRFDVQKQLIELRRVVQYHMSQPLQAVSRARQDVPGNLDALNSLPVSTGKLKILALLARLQDFGRQEGAGQIRRPIEQMRHPAAMPGRLVAGSLQILPQEEADGYFRRIEQMRDSLTDEVLAELKGRLASAPGTIEGLATVNGVLTEAARDLDDIVPVERLASLQSVAGQARERIWKDLERTIAGVPANEEGRASLTAMTTNPAYRQLAAEDSRRLAELIGARQAQAASAASDEAVAGLGAFPHTLAGLRELVAFAREERRKLARQPAASAKQAFENAYYEAHQSRIAAVADEVQDFLDEVPETRQGVQEIRTLLKAIDAPAKSELYRGAATRAQAIATAVAAAERRGQCEQALPGVDLDDDAAAELVMGFEREPLRLGDLLCDVALAGSTVHGYEEPGFFDDEHQFKITGPDGIYRTYTLIPAAIGPEREALVGVRVKDPTSERPLDVDQWRGELAALLPDTEAGRSTRCSQLMNTPESALSAQDRMEAVGCVMGSLLGR